MPIVDQPSYNFTPPPYTQTLQCYHLHQFYIIRYPTDDIWWPTTEAQVRTLLEFPTHPQLLQSLIYFLSVILFKAPTHHYYTIHPVDTFQAFNFDIPPLTVCNFAAYIALSLNCPLSFIHYSFRPSLKETFSQIRQLACNCFTGANIISEIHNFLDGHCIYTYSHLHFDQKQVYLSGQTYHCKDFCRTFPTLLAYILTPHLPPDPFTLIHAYSDKEPL